MSYQASSVASIMTRVNRDLLLPGIQRPFVWDTQQIIRLFDSLMQRYPIGSFLFWNLDKENHKDWEIYTFAEHFWFGDIHHSEVKLTPDQEVTLVLDGQQRLTSLVIGLRGSYTVKRKHKRKNNIDAWEAKVLFMDLAHSPELEDDEDGNPLDDKYRFGFFDENVKPSNKPGQLWFEVGLILAVEDQNGLNRMLRDWVENNFNLEVAQKGIAEQNLRRLWEMVWQDESIAYFTELGQSYDKVLDIFIRANDGGTKLSRGDLLMSVITLRWQQFNARDETEAIIKSLTEHLEPMRAITREFLLRATLYLADLDASIRVSNFTPANISRIEQDWERTKAVLEYTASLLRKQGLYGEDLSSINVIMMLAYYIQRLNRHRSIADLALSDLDVERIRRWVIVMMNDGVFGLQTTSLLASVRSVMRHELLRSDAFPVDAILTVFRGNGRFEGISKNWVDSFCRKKDSEKFAHLLVSLLYPGYLPSLRRKPVCLVQSRFFMPDELSFAGVPETAIPLLQSYASSLILSVALTETELQDYFNYPFDEWIRRVPDSFFEQNVLPSDRSLYKLGSLPELVIQRREMLGEYFDCLFLPEGSGRMGEAVGLGSSQESTS